MDSYKIEFKKSALKELRFLEKKIIPTIYKRIENLTYNPRPVNSVKLVTSERSYRMRIGDYRVIYQIDDELHRITICRIKHRKEVYR